MKWKRGPCEFLSEKTFLIIKGTAKTADSEKAAAGKNVPNTGTWPPKMKRAPAFCEEPERPKTANLERPSVLDPKLVDKLDMSLLSKELLCDSMTRFRQAKLSTTSSSSSSSSSLLPPSPLTRRRQSAVVTGDEQQRRATTTTIWSRDDVPVRRQRRSFEQIYDPRMIGQMENGSRSYANNGHKISPGHVAVTQEYAPVKRSSDVKKLDDNNNRKNGPAKVLSTVKKKNSRTGVPNDLEIFTTASARSAPEPCKACGRPDQPERFHSHPKGSQTKIKDIPPTTTTMTTKSRTVPVPKSIQKPVALNFRSDKNKNKPEELEIKSKDRDDQQQTATRPSSAPNKRGPRTVTCYICSREFGTASFPIHEPKCMEKWERENNALPASQRRSKPQRPAVMIEHNDWNAAAWEASQEKLIPCSKCGRTFVPDRLPVHERSCKAAPKSNNAQLERSSTVEKQVSANARGVGPPIVPCQICGRKFGTRSIKIHEPQCNRRRQMQNDSASSQKDRSGLDGRRSSTDQENSRSSYPDPSQKRTITCYICGRDFGSSSIAIHEPQCLKKWHAENDNLSPARRRREPQKPEIVYTQDPRTGNMVIDPVATTEVNWMTHLSQLVPCKRCGRTFNPDRVIVHEKSCKGNR